MNNNISKRSICLCQREKLFTFGATSGKSGGNGIGTYTAKLFAKAHGGDITFHTNDDSNSTQFTLSLPLDSTKKEN